MVFVPFPLVSDMKKFLLSLLFVMAALVMVCGNRAEARVAVSVHLGCPRVCLPCPPPRCCPPCPPRYCAPCPPPYYAPPAHCHVHRPHIHYSYPNHHGGHHAPHRVPRGHAHRR